MGKTATLNIRVNPDVKENAESVLAQLGIPMATAIDMYLKQISLVGGIPFSIVLPKAANSVNADMMSVTQIHQKLEKGYTLRLLTLRESVSAQKEALLQLSPIARSRAMFLQFIL